MPPPQYKKTRILSLGDAWHLLEADLSWELAERYAGGRVRVGTPPIRPKPQVGAVGVVTTSPTAREGENGVTVATPTGPAGAKWVADRQEAFTAFEERLRTFGDQTAGEERLFRVQLLADGQVVREEFVAVGEISPDAEVLDGLSLTYIGVLAGIALAFAFGIQDVPWWARAIIAVAAFVGLAVLLRAAVARRWVTRFARWALPGAHDTRE
jgi:hypothetical protein